jgi:hypothetical protein
MKLLKAVRTLVITLGTFGTMMPPAIARADDQAGIQPQPIQDLALDHGGVLRGQIINNDGLPKNGMLVTLSRDGEQVARTKTSSDGLFTVGGLRGGIYVVVTENSSAVVRAWSPRTAPPAAANGILLVSSDLTVRAKGKSGGPGGIGGLSMAQIGIGGLLVAGAVATVLAVTIDRSSGS